MRRAFQTAGVHCTRAAAAGLARQDDGSAMVEFAVSLSLLLLTIFSIMETCLLYYTHNVIAELAREGTHYASVRGASCPTTASPTCEVTASQVNTYVAAIALPNIGGGTVSVTTGYASAGSTTYTTSGCESVGCSVKVTVSYVFPVKMPFVPKASSNIDMSASSVATILQ